MDRESSIEKISSVKCFGGSQERFAHISSVNQCKMHFSVYFPPKATAENPVPVIYWLSGLTCTDENFVQKAGAQQYAAKYNVAIVCPDTSPRGENVPDDAEAAYDFGLGAGFYVDATEAPWSTHYNMYSYVTKELPAVLANNFLQLQQRASIMGHSMGGHGALTIALKNQAMYQSVSAFAPICSPLNCPWGNKALSEYIGENKANWGEYDACELARSTAGKLALLVDQGSDDNFLHEQLKPELLEKACAEKNRQLTLNTREGYDHSYFFIASFVEEHIQYHASHLASK